MIGYVLLAALLPIALLAWYIYRKDKLCPEPPGQLIKGQLKPGGVLPARSPAGKGSVFLQPPAALLRDAVGDHMNVKGSLRKIVCDQREHADPEIGDIGLVGSVADVHA